MDTQRTGTARKTWHHALKEAGAVLAGTAADAPGLAFNLHHSDMDPAELLQRLQGALAANPPAPVPAPPAPPGVPVPKLDADPNTRYVLRCVFRRPGCGPLQPDVVSPPTEPFALAGFFDPDAPGRTIRIPLPVDTTVAGLRQFGKNVAFLISDRLRQQMQSSGDLKKALDGKLSSGQSFDLGEICSFSIPIITLCAFIVLMVFINLLNIVFWWLPFLRVCLPINLKAR